MKRPYKWWKQFIIYKWYKCIKIYTVNKQRNNIDLKLPFSKGHYKIIWFMNAFKIQQQNLLLFIYQYTFSYSLWFKEMKKKQQRTENCPSYSFSLHFATSFFISLMTVARASGWTPDSQSRRQYVNVSGSNPVLSIFDISSRVWNVSRACTTYFISVGWLSITVYCRLWFCYSEAGQLLNKIIIYLLPRYVKLNTGRCENTNYS